MRYIVFCRITSLRDIAQNPLTPFSKMAAGGQGWQPHKPELKLILTSPTHQKNKMRPPKNAC